MINFFNEDCTEETSASLFGLYLKKTVIWQNAVMAY